jgi:hypothetical protein
MASTIKVETAEPGAIKKALNEAGWLDEEVVAAGQLRQGKAPSTLAMITGAALVEVLRPRRTKSLPRHFVLAATADRIVAFKASGGSRESDRVYEMRVKPDEQGSWPRSEVRIVDLPEGATSKGGTLKLGIESLPVARPNLSGDPSTDELIELLST